MKVFMYLYLRMNLYMDAYTCIHTDVRTHTYTLEDIRTY